MKVYKYPANNELKEILKRPAIDTSILENRVEDIIKKVAELGDPAIKDFTKLFDGVELNELSVSAEEIAEADVSVDEVLKQAIQQAASNIKKFHEVQLSEIAIDTMPGVKCWRKNIPIERVGLYIPGGSAPLFSTILMLGIPAKIAGCKEIILCSPPGPNGQLAPEIIYTAGLAGISRIYKVGGVQAIAAMAFGTETIPRVHKIFGPGNQYVTCAKQLIQRQGIAIDMPAGPSELCVLADKTANPVFVAADLLSQAEHGADSQVLLVTTESVLAEQVQEQVQMQLDQLPRKEIAIKALANSRVIIVQDIQRALDIINEYAPEHLILSCENDEKIADKIINAGSVFLGNYSPESVGDYASGTNHTLPTNGYAKAYSGVSVDSFVKKVTFQKLTREGLNSIGNTVELMAEAEGLFGHKNAVTVRRMKEEV